MVSRAYMRGSPFRIETRRLAQVDKAERYATLRFVLRTPVWCGKLILIEKSANAASRGLFRYLGGARSQESRAARNRSLTESRNKFAPCIEHGCGTQKRGAHLSARNHQSRGFLASKLAGIEFPHHTGRHDHHYRRCGRGSHIVHRDPGWSDGARAPDGHVP